MQRPLLVSAAAVAASLALGAFVACSTSSSASSPGAGEDASTGGVGPDQPPGSPCDPSLADPCAPSHAVELCFTITCDPTSKLCVENATNDPMCPGYDASDDTSADASEQVGAPCTMASDCADAGEVCGFSPLEQCSATGVCVVPVTVSLADGGPALACSCDGVTVSYVTSTLTSAPVSSTAPCPDGGVDAGEDAGAIVDAAADDAG